MLYRCWEKDSAQDSWGENERIKKAIVKKKGESETGGQAAH